MKDSSINSNLRAAIVVLGFSAIITQTILLREFLTVFSGNELVIGVVLGNWMILTGVGSLVGRRTEGMRRQPRLLVLSFFLISFLPALTAFLLSWLRNSIFPLGAVLGIGECFAVSAVLLLPYCLVSGALFTLLSVVASEQAGSNRTAFVYSLESAGSVIGGLLFNVVLIFFFSTFQALLLLALIDLGACCILSVAFGSRTFQVVSISSGAVLLLIVARLDLDTTCKRMLYPQQDLFFHCDTPYGNLVVTRTGEQLNFFENSSLLFVTGDRTANEDAVHYALIQHSAPKRVLLIGGGISGTTGEILKHGVERLDYAEVNPSIVELGSTITNALADERIRVVPGDGRRYVKNCTETYDVVLVNVPDPSTAQLNRYYTAQFMREVRGVLSPVGIVALSLLPSDDYVGTEARRLSSVVYRTLKAEFRNILILPGLRNHYIASNGDLTTNIAAGITSRRIDNASVNQYYLDDELLAQRSELLKNGIDSERTVNDDFHPVAYFHQLQYWLSYFTLPVWIPGAVFAMLFIVIAVRLDTVSLGMFAGGFAASALEVVILIAFQVIYGYVYHAIGIVIALFMGGLALGAFLGHRARLRSEFTSFIRVQALLGLYAILLPVILNILDDRSSSETFAYAIFVFLTILVGMIVGFEFSLASQLLRERVSRVASILYSVDLIGGAIGALLLSVYLLPMFGLAQSCTIIAAVGLLGPLAAFVRGDVPSTGVAGVSAHV